MNPYYDQSAIIAALIGTILVVLFFAVIGYVLTSLFLMKIFEKAGVQGKWRAWVPIYNAMIFTKLGDLSPWLVLISFGGAVVLSWIPVLNIFAGLLSLAGAAVMLMAAWRVGLKLQKDAIWVVLYFFLSIVWLGINAFDKSRWNPQIAPAPWAAQSFLADSTVWDGVPQQPSAPAAPQPGYGAPQQGYGAPQGYQAPQQQGYQPPAAAPQTPPAPPAATPAAGSAPVSPQVPPAPPAAPAEGQRSGTDPDQPMAPPAAPNQPPA